MRNKGIKGAQLRQIEQQDFASRSYQEIREQIESKIRISVTKKERPREFFERNG